MKKLSKIQKLQFSILIIAGCLFFYAVGIATGFFGLPIFSSFWIVSNETAHGVLLIWVLAVVVAISAVSILVLITGLVKKRETAILQSQNITVFRPVKTVEKTVGASSSTSLKTSANLQSRAKNAESRSTNAVMKSMEQSTTAKDATVAHPNVEKKSVNRQAQIARPSAKIDDIEHEPEYSANTQSSNSQPPSINVKTNQQASISPKETSKPQPPQLPKINNEKKQTPISKNQKKKKQNKKTAPKA